MSYNLSVPTTGSQATVHGTPGQVANKIFMVVILVAKSRDKNPIKHCQAAAKSVRNIRVARFTLMQN